MNERLFVLAPLLELDRDPPLPGGLRVADLPLPATHLEAVRLFAPALPV
jgi:hypothetical protein